jgi:hypothetical protein
MPVAAALSKRRLMEYQVIPVLEAPPIQIDLKLSFAEFVAMYITYEKGFDGSGPHRANYSQAMQNIVASLPKKHQDALLNLSRPGVASPRTGRQVEQKINAVLERLSRQ